MFEPTTGAPHLHPRVPPGPQWAQIAAEQKRVAQLGCGYPSAPGGWSILDAHAEPGVQGRPYLPGVSWQVMMEPEVVPFLPDAKFGAESAVSSRASPFSSVPETQGLRGSELGGWGVKGCSVGECSVLWKLGNGSFSHSSACTLAPGPAGGILSPLNPTTRPSVLFRGSRVRRPFTCLIPGWCWDGVGWEGDWVLTGSWAPGAAGPVPSSPPPSPIPSWLQKGSGGGGNFTGKLLFLPRTDTGWGPSFPLAATETGAT